MESSSRICEPSELQQSHLFRSTSLQAIKGLLQHCRIRKLSAGEQLLASGQPNHSIYVLLSGRLLVYLDDSSGDPHLSLESGDCVGEMSIIDQQLTSANVIAADECRVLEVGEGTLWSLLDRSPIVARNLLEVLTHRLRHDNSVIRRSQQLQRHYEHHAATDPLTGLFNRRWLDEMLPRQMACCIEGGQPFSLFIADIDFFKDFNDSYGHLAGDQAIKAIARVISNNLRKSDMAVRFGGEEFLVLLPGSDRLGAANIAERIRVAVKETALRHTDGRELPAVTVSIGIAETIPGYDAVELIEKADNALYLAKQKGRDNIVT